MAIKLKDFTQSNKWKNLFNKTAGHDKQWSNPFMARQTIRELMIYIDTLEGQIMYLEQRINEMARNKAEKTVMTLRDKVAEMEPDKVSTFYDGGVENCPGDYPYLHNDCEVLKSTCPYENLTYPERCFVCWNQPFVEKKEDQNGESV